MTTYIQPRKDQRAVDIAPLEDCISRNAFDQIIRSPDLFWLAFCKAFHQHSERRFAACPNPKLRRRMVKLSFSSVQALNTITLTGTVRCFSATQTNIEKIRSLFLRGWVERREFQIIETYTDKGAVNYEDPNQIIEDNQEDIIFNSSPYCSIGCMDILAQTVNACCDKPNFLLSEKRTYNVRWISFEPKVYKVAPIQIPERIVSENAMYELYRQQLFCDLTLIAEDGQIKAHATALYIHGGKVMNALLTSNMKECVEKELHFKEFSLDTLKVFLDYIYLGQKALTDLQKKVNLIELFKLAHFYQLDELINCCTNEFCHLATAEDLEVIKTIIDTYENAHLKRLYEHLLSINQAKD